MTPDQEQQRMIAVLQGNYLAKHFPNVWLNQQQAKPTNDLGRLVQQLLNKHKDHK